MNKPATQPHFTLGKYSVRRVAKAGIWLVTAELAVDLGMLFLRAQEFYESGCTDIVGKPFTLHNYMRWYSLNVSELKAFTYCHDFDGFNVPSEAIDRLALIEFADYNHYDVQFARLSSTVAALQGGNYYLIGAVATNVSTAEHEFCHGLYDLVPAYRAAMVRLVDALPTETYTQLAAVLAAEGYSGAVMVDEIQAYMSTGLLDSMSHLEKHRHPFMQVFARYRRRHIKD